MAMFRGIAGPIKSTQDQYMRTNTKLQAGTHDSPGEKFLVDNRLKRLFRYHFGGDGWVVIPKGRIVAPATDNFGESQDGVINDFDGNVKRPVLTLANGGKDVTEVGKDGTNHVRKANRAIGVAYGNLYEEFVDGFNGMQPTIENEIYIELPYIPKKSDAEEIEWGSFYDADLADFVKNGDFVISDENGRFIKAPFEKVYAALDAAATAGDLAEYNVQVKELGRLQEQVVGQVWSVETNLPPQGWLKWVTWSTEDMRQDDKWINNSGFRPEDMGATDGFPGYPYDKTYRNMEGQKYFPRAIPGLTNGANIEVPFTDLVIGTVQPGQSGRHDLRIWQVPIVEGSLVVTANGTPIQPTYVDYELGLVTVNFDNAAGSAPVDIKATFKATGQIPGVPTNWDWKGSVGAVRILLQK
ncbi:hypothetical protein SAMN02799624_05221 [Paenibacillus sp. UNC496MF]|uniref:hypothetical protein n=1 Tax=Paenibacillus sp. UNC496MF TaxID=1502753 RepID=UPI0008EB5672|nr:hypothetical protein [Paenibacillus sp. UNC496MF]SFJ62362.1 hypothetical protein SAMN02799624_05221 [Paenibacillus sp. UNC496MF]